LKVLLSAYSCSPDSGSEPAIGWNWAKCIAARGHDVVVITRSVNRHSIEAWCEKGDRNHIRFVFHDLLNPMQLLYRVPFGDYAYYVLWQYTASRCAARLHAQEKFDRVHHITWGSFRAPSFMGKLPVPFTFGPVAGGEDTPRDLRKGLGWRGRLWDSVRRLSNNLLPVNLLVRSNYAQATEILTCTAETLDKMPPAYRHKVRVQQSIGIAPENFLLHPITKRKTSPRGGSRKLEILYVGRLVAWKGLHLALQAIAALGESKASIRFTIVGTGYEERRLRRLADRLKLGNCVEWISWMPRKELLRKYSEFDLFLFPSLHDSGGMAVLEALTVGLPVVCLDLGGPGMLVDRTCGVVIPARGLDENQVVAQITGTLTELLSNPVWRSELSDGALRRSRALTWEANVQNVYGEPLAVSAN
jgi:glycosyltransferase involved in cell wall biosynthesis